MREWLRCGFALLSASGLMALLDGWLQLSNPQPFFQREMMGFALLNAWALCFPAWILIGVLKSKLNSPVRTAHWTGLAIGITPLLGSNLPGVMFLLPGLIILGLGQLKHFNLHTMPPVVEFGQTILLAAFLLASPFLPQTTASLSPNHYNASADTRPVPQGIDVFLISVDTLRADAIVDDPNTEGDSTAPTPFLDRIRPSSLWADYAWSSSNQTLPGHVGMLTGVNAMVHGVRSNVDLPDAEVPLISEYFQDAGWHTSGVISNALLSAATGMNRGYDSYSDEPIGLGPYAILLSQYLHENTWSGFLFSEERTRLTFQRIFFRKQLAMKEIPLADRVMKAAIPQLKANYASERPFFQFLHFMDPHTAYRPPSQLRGILSGALAPQVAKRFLPSPDAEISLDMVRSVEEALKQGDPEATVAARYYHQVYLEEMVYVDQKLEAYFDLVNKSGRPYVVLFTADHGEQFGEHNLMDHANSLYEKNIQVPFMLWGEGVIAAHLMAAPHSADVAPTLLTLAGVALPDSFTGMPVTRDYLTRTHVVVDQKEMAVTVDTGLKWTGAWPTNADNEVLDSDPIDVRMVNLFRDPAEVTDLLSSSSKLPVELQRLIAEFSDADTWFTRQTDAKRSAAQDLALSALGYADQEDDR
ncbi:MAG: sulfatase-like hydrolase/transferase [Planctomycetota bacterium]